MGSQCSKSSAADLAVKPRGADCDDKELSPATLCATMKASLPIGTRHRSPLKKFANCFTSVEAVDWMLQHKQARDEGEAVRKCQTLLTRGLIEQVDGSAEFECNSKRFYRFTSAAAY
ncbi:hypothetical protein PRIC1_014478 [Phytophthora ramorum]